MLEINCLIETRLFEDMWCDKSCSTCFSSSKFNKDCNNKFLHAVRYSLSGNDNRLRTILMLLISRAHKKEEISLPIALAFECIHNSAIILDDIFDNGTYRNGKKCTYIAFSKPTAVLVSSYLVFKAFRFLEEIKNNIDYGRFVKIHEIFSTYPQNLISGEFKKNNLRVKKCTRQDYFDVMLSISAGLTSFGFKAVAIAIKDERHFIANAEIFGLNLGCLLQIQNDLLDICGYDNPFDEPHDYNLLDLKNNDPNILTTLLFEYTDENISYDNIHALIDRDIKDMVLTIAENYHAKCIDCIPNLVFSEYENQIRQTIDSILEVIKTILYSSGKNGNPKRVIHSVY